MWKVATQSNQTEKHRQLGKQILFDLGTRAIR